jgi:putative ABC transport system permease protein
MEWFNALRLRIRSLWLRRRLERDLREETEFHMSMREEDLRRQGNPDPRRQARIHFGNAARVREDCRDAWSFVRLERLFQDLRYSARTLVRNPGFTTVAVLTLALGIGANSAVFSAIDTILLRPLSFPEGDELVMVQEYVNKRQNTPTPVAPIRLADWDHMNTTFQAVTGYYTEDISETSGELPEKITRAIVAPRFFEVWGVWPALGRGFTSEERHFNGPTAVVISDRLWRRRFHADPGVIGHVLRSGKTIYPIVGVMPSSFQFPERSVDVWFPCPVDAPYAQGRDLTWYTVIGRLRPGVSIDQAQTDLTQVQERLGQEYPKTDTDLATSIRPLKDVTIGDTGHSLWILYGSVSVLLLIACINIAALMLARTADREQEISIRVSLGATRSSLLSRLLSEVFLIALAGSVLGLFLAASASNVFRILADKLPRVEEVRLDWTLVFYSFSCAIGATIVCGLLPAFRSIRRGIAGTLARRSRSQVYAGGRTQWTLVGMQVALAVTLLVGAGLLIRSIQELGRVSAGFDPSHVLTFRISASWGETTDIPAIHRRIDTTLESLRALPGVEAASTALSVPGVPAQYETELRVLEGSADPNRRIVADSRIVSDEYFSTLHIPILSGEACGTSSESTVLVNQSFANAYLGGISVIGRHIDYVRRNPYVQPARILGIAGDAREEGLNQPPPPLVYWCNNAGTPNPVFLVRTAGSPAALAASIRNKVHELEPNRSVYDILPLEDHIHHSFDEDRLRTILLSFFAFTAVALACIGLYGTLSYCVDMRRREVGLRLALGARPWEIVAQFFRQGLVVYTAGCIAGVALAFALGQTISGFLYGVTLWDPLTIAGVLGLVFATGSAASLLPAFRASRVRPDEVLREE